MSFFVYLWQTFVLVLGLTNETYIQRKQTTKNKMKPKNNLLIINIFIVFIALFTLNACKFSGSEDKKVAIYYDWKGFVEKQIQFLQKQTISVEKNATINGNSEKKTLKSLKWHKELDLLLEADINKKAFEGLYNVLDSVSSENKYKIYTAKNTNLVVRKLTITSDKNDMITKMNANLISTNPLYHSEKQLFASFDNQNGQPKLQEYHYSGKQKMILMKEEQFEITGKVSF